VFGRNIGTDFYPLEHIVARKFQFFAGKFVRKKSAESRGQPDSAVDGAHGFHLQKWRL